MEGGLRFELMRASVPIRRYQAHAPSEATATPLVVSTQALPVSPLAVMVTVCEAVSGVAGAEPIASV